MDLQNLASLKIIWDVLKPVLLDQIKERLRAKDSASRAKELSFLLYETLIEVDRGIDNYIISLQDYTQLCTEREALESERSEARTLAQKNGLILFSSLEEAKRVLHKLELQLQIHTETLEKDMRFVFTKEVDLARPNFVPYEDNQGLSVILTQAIENQQLFHVIKEDYRKFLADKFSYKESF